MIKLKDYVDFVTSLTQMDEVKQGKFKTPTNMEFNLNKEIHRGLHKEVIEIKRAVVNDDNLYEPFEVVIHNITLKFTHE